MKIQMAVQKHIAEFMALKQVYHQRLTSVNSYLIEKFVYMGLNEMIEYANQQKDRIHFYQKQIKERTISFCTGLSDTTQFTLMLIFSRPAVEGYARPCDMGALCM